MWAPEGEGVDLCVLLVCMWAPEGEGVDLCVLLVCMWAPEGEGVVATHSGCVSDQE